eukprot:5036108-Prymnesium_polylepis.1
MNESASSVANCAASSRRVNDAVPTGTYVTLQLPNVTPSLGECHALKRRGSLPDLGSPRRFATNQQ